MKLHKLISRTVLATALLGATVGAAFSGNNISVNAQDKEQLNYRVTDDSKDKSSTNYSNSGAQADITSGLLTLNAVPNLNFGNNNNDDNNHTLLHLMNSNTDPSNNINPNITDRNDGNSDNLLKVTDYRPTDKSNYGGWTVNAKLGNFQPIDNTRDGQYNSGDQWHIDLSNSNIQDNYYGNNYNRYINGNNNSQESNEGPNIHNNVTLGSNNNPANVMGTNNNYSNGHGVTNLNYSNQNTSLTTPYNVQPGKYMATITWTLSANIDSGSNSVNN